MTSVRTTLLCFMVPLLLPVVGCIDLQLAGQRAHSGSNGNPTPPDGTNDGSGAGGDQSISQVTLSVSNATPQVHEQVVLTCVVTNDAPGPFAFDFEPENGQLIDDQVHGSATLIIGEGDVGTAFSFTCTATNDSGTSEPSNAQTIMATSTDMTLP